VQVTDRRIMPRRRVRMPLRFRVVATGRPPAGGPGPVLTGESLNVSERGVYFLTDFPLGVGCQLELFLPLAYDPAAGCATELRCTARVVHCQAHPGPSRATGVGAFIECFDPPAWASSQPVPLLF
jgi:hypothetical protein